MIDRQLKPPASATWPHLLYWIEESFKLAKFTLRQLIVLHYVQFGEHPWNMASGVEFNYYDRALWEKKCIQNAKIKGRGLQHDFTNPKEMSTKKI